MSLESLVYNMFFGRICLFGVEIKTIFIILDLKEPNNYSKKKAIKNETLVPTMIPGPQTDRIKTSIEETKLIFFKSKSHCPIKLYLIFFYLNKSATKVRREYLHRDVALFYHVVTSRQGTSALWLSNDTVTLIITFVMARPN